MSKIFKTSDDIAEMIMSKFNETGLPQMGVDIKIMSLTKANSVIKVSRASATTDFLTDGGGSSIHVFVYEEAFDRLSDDMKIKLIEGALSNVAYDTEKDKLLLDTSQYGEVIRMRKKYENYLDIVETGTLLIASIEDEEKQRKEEEKSLKKSKNK